MTKRATAKSKANGANSHLNSTNNVVILRNPFGLKNFSAITRTQAAFFKAYDSGKQLFLNGYAGTGKTFIALYRALKDVDGDKPLYKKVVIVRSAVEVRSIGALPGDAEEKLNPFEQPYMAICSELYGHDNAYDRLKREGIIQFIPTSFIRGITLNDCIIIVDEASNLSQHELDSVITRVGKNCRIIFCGDYRQSDLKEMERRGYMKFEEIIARMPSFEIIEFTASDIVRSGLVKEYLIASEQ